MAHVTTKSKSKTPVARRKRDEVRPAPTELRDPKEAVGKLEATIDMEYRRILEARDDDTFIKWANSLGMNVMRLVNSHRILRFLSLNFIDREEAIRALDQINYDEA